MYKKVKEDLDYLSKELYLNSPDLWLEFLDKVNEGIIDELVLFCAIKHNYNSIVEYAIANNLVNLISKSKNRDFKNIYSHLVYVANQCNNQEAYDLLLSVSNKSIESRVRQTKKMTISENKKDTKNSINQPRFICNHCSSNVFEKGYTVVENKTFKFSTKDNNVIEFDSNTLDLTLCANCQSPLQDITHKDLKALCHISSCSSCYNDLREVGIVDKKEMIYDKQTNSFTYSNPTFVCSKCSNPINNEQVKYFNLNK